MQRWRHSFNHNAVIGIFPVRHLHEKLYPIHMIKRHLIQRVLYFSRHLILSHCLWTNLIENKKIEDPSMFWHIKDPFVFEHTDNRFQISLKLTHLFSLDKQRLWTESDWKEILTSLKQWSFALQNDFEVAFVIIFETIFFVLRKFKNGGKNTIYP